MNGAKRLNGLNNLNLKLEVTEGAEDLRIGEFNHKGRIKKFVGAALCGCPEPVSEGRI